MRTALRIPKLAVQAVTNPQISVMRETVDKSGSLVRILAPSTPECAILP
jgi:hypothetical protein